VRPDNATYAHHPHRGISQATFEFYNVLTEFVNDDPTRVAFVYPNKAIKFRNFNEKVFNSEGPMSDAGCFGTDKFDPGSKESIVITEGEYDTLAAYEALRASMAVISVRSASSAKRDCTRDYEFINSFSKIILAFDGDEPGESAARAVSSLFDFSKVYHVRLRAFKDANAYLEAGKADDFVATVRSAKRYAPDNIISTLSEFAGALKKHSYESLGTYPFACLQDRLFGIHSEEVICFKGLEGIGKTEVFRAIEYHLLSTTELNIGIIHLEESNGETLKALAGYQLDAPAVLPDSGVSDADVLGALDTLGGDKGRIHVHSSYDVEDEHAILDNIRFLASGAGCRVIFLDHISWLATGQTDDDERKKLDRISQKLKLLAKELKIAIIEISHVNDAGQTRGSRNITKSANTVVNMSRDLTNPDEKASLTTHFTIEKARLGGRTGYAGSAIFDRETYKLRETLPEDTIKVPAV
jgi:twinkle protein